MRTHPRSSSAVLTLLALGALAAGGDRAVRDDELGLSKGSVFATPDPIVAESAAKDPGENEPLGAYAPGTPPLIPHRIEDFLPITLDGNLCADCHDLPDQIGKEREAGEATPMPASHYTDLRRSPGTVGKKLIGARFVCTQCHATQAAAPPLVPNTYRR